MVNAVIAELKEIVLFGDGVPLDGSIGGFVPLDPEHFGVNAQLLIGTADSDRSDSFDVVVCTPSWASEALSAPDWDRFDRGLRAIPAAVMPASSVWFMRRWDRAAFETAVGAVCAASSPGPDWGTVASRIGRYLPWEFAYKYDAHVNKHYGQPFPPE